MGKSGAVITLEVMKGAAFYHGLAKLVEDQPKSKYTYFIIIYKVIFLQYLV